MKRVLCFSVVLFLVVLPCPVKAQDVQAYGFATNVSAQGQVVELDFPEFLDGVSFLIVWVTAKGQFVKVIYARSGTHCYEMRTIPEWNGDVNVVATTAPGISGRVKTPTLSDEIDLSLAPEPLGETTVNFLAGHTLFAWSWNAWLLVVLLLFATSLVIIRKKRVVPSLLLGFRMACGVMALRTAYDHLFILSRTEKYMAVQHGMFPLAGAKGFAEHASEIIGPSTWSDTAIGKVNGSYLRYSLAEHSFVPADSNMVPEFLVTENPKDAPVAFKYGGYFLVKRNRP